MGRIPLSVKNNYARNNHLKPDDGNVQVAIPRPNPFKLGIYGWGLFAHRDIQEGEMEAATDLTTLLIELFNSDHILQKSSFFIVAESYGGKFAIHKGKLKLKLGGVVLGDSWISPEDFVVLCLAAMEKPVSLMPEHIRGEKVKVISSEFVKLSLA
ncbi:hypothetical protein JHK87_006296 [Glycine soja]|nr:hypothetical protein JHK87_006296 [Glycine soja]